MAIYLLGGRQTDFARVWSREGLEPSDMLRDSIVNALDGFVIGRDNQSAGLSS